MEACWAHNPEVRRSKLRSARAKPFVTNGMRRFCNNVSFVFSNGVPVPLAQRIARWTSNPKVLGSIPRWDETFFPLESSARSFLTAPQQSSRQDGRVV